MGTQQSEVGQAIARAIEWITRQARAWRARQEVKGRGPRWWSSVVGLVTIGFVIGAMTGRDRDRRHIDAGDRKDSLLNRSELLHELAFAEEREAQLRRAFSELNRRAERAEKGESTKAFRLEEVEAVDLMFNLNVGGALVASDREYNPDIWIARQKECEEELREMINGEGFAVVEKGTKDEHAHLYLYSEFNQTRDGNSAVLAIAFVSQDRLHGPSLHFSYMPSAVPFADPKEWRSAWRQAFREVIFCLTRDWKSARKTNADNNSS